MRPNVGRNPVTPQRVHGDTIDPNVSVPMENPTKPAEVADAEPAEEPLEPCSGSQGFRVFSPNQTSPQANAPNEVLASKTAPASFNLSTIVAFSLNFCSLKGVAPQVVR